MRWSHYRAEEYPPMIAAAGFDIDLAEIVEHTFAGETERHLVVLAAAS